MKRKLSFVAAVAGVSLLAAALQKPLFMLWYCDRAAACGGNAAVETLRVMMHGLKLDISVAGYVTAVPLLVLLVATFFVRPWFKTLLKAYFVVVSALTAAAFTLNIALYEYWAFPLDSSILQFLASPRQAAASVNAWQWVVYLSMAAVVGTAVAWGYFSALRLFDAVPARQSIGSRAAHAATLLLASGFCFLAIRGGTGVATANISKAFFSRETFLNHAAVNPLFSFLSTLAHDDDEMWLYDYLPEEERARIMAEIFACEGGNAAGGRACGEFAAHDAASETGAGGEIVPAGELLTTRRPDIVLFIVESFGCSTLFETVGGQEVAPNFRRMIGEGVYFSDMFANSVRTDRGTTAILSGFPAQTRSSIMKDPARSRRLPSIAASLRREGYATSFYHGGDLNFTNMSSYLYATGYDSLTSLKDMRFDAPTSKWGYADDVTLDDFARRVQRLSRGERPFFATMLTLSSHEPFDVPFERFDDKMLNSMAFTDECLGRFVETMKASPAWDDLLIIFIADHSYLYPYGIDNSSPERYRIPMLWTGGAVRSPRTIDTYASQTDLAATLLTQLGIASDDFAFSRDILATGCPRFGYFCYNNGFGVADAEGATVFDCTTGRVISPDSSARQLEIGKAMLQTTWKTIRDM